MPTTQTSKNQNLTSELPTSFGSLWLQALCFAVAATALSQSMQISEGFDEAALLGVTVAFVWCIAGIALPRVSWSSDQLRKACYATLGVAAALQLSQLLLARHGLSTQVFKAGDVVYSLAIAGVMIVTLCAVWFWNHARWRWLRYIGFPAILIAHFYLGAKAIQQNGGFGIDVLVIQHESVKALLHGINPFSITFVDIHEGRSNYYGEGLVENGRLMFGYVYPPFSLLMGVPGYLLGGDVRYSNLAAITLTGAFLGYARFSRLSFLAAVVFLFTPPVFYILVRCWTDVFITLFLAATLFCACRFPRWTFIPFGLMIAVKQHLFLCVPLALLLMPPLHNRKNTRRFFAESLCVVLAVTLPLAFWNVKDFLYSGLLINFKQPFRTDSLNYSALWALNFGTQPSSLFGFLLLIPTYFFLLRSSARTPAGFAGAFALFYFVFFLFGRQAFLNYYYTIFAALCGAIATIDFSNHAQSESGVDVTANDINQSLTSSRLATTHNKYS